MVRLKQIILLIAVMGIGSAISFPAYALLLGNPAHSIKGGDFAVGLGLGDNRYELFGNIGLGKAGVLDLFMASEEESTLAEKDEFGIGYRHNLGKSFTVADMKIQMGVLSQIRQGTITASGLELDYMSIDLGVGGSISPLEGLNVYAAGVYERVTVDVDLGVFGTVSVTDTNMGFVVGVEYMIDEGLIAGAELHPGLDESSFIMFGILRF